MTMPPDPTPLTDAEIQQLVELEAKATYVPWNNQYNRMHVITKNWRSGQSIIAKCCTFFDGDFIAALRNAAPSLLAAARENAGLREKAESSKFWLRRWKRIALYRESLVSTLTAERDHWKTAAESVTSTWQDVAAERDAAIRERDDRIRANVRLCEEIKNHRAERDEWKLRYEKQCEGTLSREMRVSNLRNERDAALARVAELEKRLTLSLDDPRATAGALLERLESHHKPCPPNCDEEGHECVPPPDPKWVRCPNGCMDGVINAGCGIHMTCCWCVGSGKPGWVKETPQ